MAEDRRLAGVKTLLRSVLQSVKEGVPARRISGDYHGITGEPLPYRALGYQSVEALMAAIPDTVMESRDNKTGEKVYKAIADESTAHIAKMVSKQKSNKKRTKGGGAGHMRRPTVYVKRGVRQRTYQHPRPPYSGTYNSRPPPAYPSRQPQSFAAAKRPTHTYTPPAKPAPTPARPASASYTTFSFGGKESGFSAAANQKGSEPSIFKAGRNINESPQGGVRVTFQPTPSPNKPVSSASRLHPNQTLNSAANETGKFSSNYKVPPRFQRMMNTQTSPSPKDAKAEVCNDSHRYIQLLETYISEKGYETPHWDTMTVPGGYACVVTVRNHTHGGGGVYTTQEDAKQAAARAACQALKCIKGDPLYSPRNGTAHSQRYGEADIRLWQERVKELVSRRQNGLWCSRLPVEYKEKYKEELPDNIADLLEEWPHVVEVQGQDNLKILYPVTSKAPASPLSSTRTNEPRTPQVSTPPWRKGRSPTVDHSARPESLCIASATQPAKGTTLDIYVCYVEDASLFYVHLKDTCITQLTKDVNNLAERSPLLERDQRTVGRYVTAHSEDEIFYRAQIIATKQRTTEVYYVDFGNSEELAHGRLRELQSSLYKQPAQAVRCSLHQAECFLTEQHMQQLNNLIDNQCKMTVIEIQEDLCLVDLYDEKGKKLFEVKPPKATEPAPLQLPTESQWDVIVTYIATANQIILRLVGEEYSEKLEATEALLAENGIGNSSYTPAVGDLCAACITTSTAEDDNPFYRVRVTQIEGNNALCECVDYGDSEIVPWTQLRPLMPAEAELPFQAVVSYLTGLERQEDNEAVVEQLTRMVLNRSCVADVNSRDGDPSVTLYDTSTDEDINITEVITEVLNVRDLKPVLPKGEEMVEAFVSFIDVDGLVHLQIQGPGLVKLEALTKKVTGVYSKGGAEYFVHNLQEGRLVMSLFRDGGWYRAIIKRILPDRLVLVLFIDYGNEEVIACTSLRELEVASKPLYNLPHQAITVSLEKLPPPGFTWTPAARDELSDRAPDDVAIYVRTVEPATDQEPAIVQIHRFVDSEFISISEEMLDPSIWIEPALDTSLNITSSSEGEISDASFTSQQANDVLDEAKGLFEQLGMTTDIGAGDDIFLLAGDVSKTLRITESPCSGTDSSTSSGVESSPSPISSDLKDQNSNDTVVNDKTIVERLSPEEYSRLPSPPDARLPPSGSEVFVTWVGDPSDFTFVVYKELDASEELMNKMAVFYYQEGAALTVDEPQIGVIYAALYEDERWYRVRVKNIINQALLGKGTMVSALLVDFGSFNLLPVTSLRQLTPEFRKTPVNAIKATLAGVSPEAGIWSEDSVSRIEELISERKFVARIHTDHVTPVPVTLVNTEVEGDEALIHKRLIAEGLAVSSPMTYNAT